MLTFPASFDVTTESAASQVESLVSDTGAIAFAQGYVYNVTNILSRGIQPKLDLKDANLLSAAVNRGSTKTTGRSMLVRYGIQVRDINNVLHKLGNYWAFATFSPCSSIIESVYLPKELTTNQVQSYIETFPGVAESTTNKAVQQAGLTDTAAAVPLQAASPPPPPRDQSSTLSTVGSGLVNGTNAILKSPAAQDALYTAFQNSTFTCPGSTLDNMQFCDGFSGSYTYGK